MTDIIATKIERITARIGAAGKRQTLLIEITRETPGTLSGYRVNNDGGRYEIKTPSGGYAHHLYVLAKTDISKRTPMVMNLTYAELEPAS